ncbi:NAD(P)-dependent oxidoreductase [Anabaenopsis tanganyikae CS-531]|uniref:NAD(P)-dependent oxidoreductase n=2 Tax=Anabaenopsis TaxID=110103 RepID=A0ABT6KA10_9CYAN|nr:MULTISPECIES: NAD(P)-dependent oxidoreductase [Anabaenopsis]MDB9539656.1 NAD(P)-dependent oxidoreductase [Anabaenopsis arnoldii]MDH6091961.1 NAD(P)-dependent oxidoreductase [Anabaenopsis arnoldii]MDH6104450.1 NAD(P)-dependent oxidoreductase [Anabaenopsis tanganyikae CS-531]
MQEKRILVTGASGCIGHYITEALIENTSHELYLLVRNPAKLQVDTQVRSGINVIEGDMQKLDLLADLLPTIDTAVLTATAWGGEQTFDVNVSKTLELIKMLDPQRCEQVIYFSTASVLDRHNQPLPEAGEIGTDYIRSKYDCLQKMSQLEIAGKITKVFPTLVLGGDETKPYSHLTGGIAEVTKYINLIRFLQVDGSFHFIHGQDIATVVEYLIDSPPQANQTRQFVLGQPALTANQAVADVCAYLNKKIYFRIPLSLALANLIITIFRIQMADWDRFCMNYRHFSYENVINPGIWGLPNYCATMRDVLRISGVKEGKV